MYTVLLPASVNAISSVSSEDELEELEDAPLLDVDASVEELVEEDSDDSDWELEELLIDIC